MKRQRKDQFVTHSSIALLQERFRQLKRAKEMREEREFLRMLSESRQDNPTRCYDPSRLFFHSELILPPTLSLQSSPSFQPTFQSKHTDLPVTQTPILANLWAGDKVIHRSKNNFDDSYVDTSLHL